MAEPTTPNRRQFLAWLGGAGLTLATFRGSARTRSRHVLIQRSSLAGFQYHHGKALWEQLQQGDALALHREPDNPYDRRAARVDWRDWKLGYVPRVENTAVAQMLNRGERLDAYVTSLSDGPRAWDRIELAIWMRV